MIFIDSSVVYNALVKTELTPLAERVFEEKRALEMFGSSSKRTRSSELRQSNTSQGFWLFSFI